MQSLYYVHGVFYYISIQQNFAFTVKEIEMYIFIFFDKIASHLKKHDIMVI